MDTSGLADKQGLTYISLMWTIVIGYRLGDLPVAREARGG